MRDGKFELLLTWKMTVPPNMLALKVVTLCFWSTSRLSHEIFLVELNECFVIPFKSVSV